MVTKPKYNQYLNTSMKQQCQTHLFKKGMKKKIFLSDS